MSAQAGPAGSPAEDAAEGGTTAKPPWPRRAAGAVAGWLAPEVPLARVAAFRILIYAFLVLDVTWVRTSVIPHGYVPELYQPTWLARALHLPPFGPEVGTALLWVILLGCAAGIATTLWGRWQRTVGWVVAAAFWVWMLNSQGYGYVSHDHLALMIAVTVLPTVGVATLRDGDTSQAAGWALRCVQLGVVATYVGSAVLKTLRAGTPAGWANSAVFVWAIMRRGSALVTWTLEHPWLLILGQWGLIILEFLSPVVLWLKGKWLYGAVLVFVGFHAVTFASIGIHFLPTVVCWAAFLPLERLPFLARLRRAA